MGFLSSFSRVNFFLNLFVYHRLLKGLNDSLHLYEFFDSLRVHPIWISLDTDLCGFNLKTFDFCSFFENFRNFRQSLLVVERIIPLC